MSLDPDKLAAAVDAGRFEWRLHVLKRLAERGIRQEAVLSAVRDGDCIERYPEDTPFPSALFCGRREHERPLHVVAAYDQKADWAYIITAYLPDEAHFMPDWKTRRQP